MKNLLLLVLLYTVVSANCQQVTSIDFHTEARNYDFSDLLTMDSIFTDNGKLIKRGEASGLIGDEQMTIHAEYLSVIRNSDDNLEYLVHGRTTVDGNTCDFQGVITLQSAVLLPAKADELQKKGTISGKFKFFEDPDQHHTGIFEGTFETHFVIATGVKNLQYSAIQNDSDILVNNIFKGFWKKYDTGASQQFSWADSTFLSRTSEYVLPEPLNLGAFSVSLTVKDINASFEFYKKLGFTALGGNIEQNWLVMRNGQTVIGLFQGMFPRNMLTFNPGWNQQAKEVNPFTDVRDIQTMLKKRGVELSTEADMSTSGPAYITLTDPDGNPILIDQHR